MDPEQMREYIMRIFRACQVFDLKNFDFLLSMSFVGNKNQIEDLKASKEIKDNQKIERTFKGREK